MSQDETCAKTRPPLRPVKANDDDLIEIIRAGFLNIPGVSGVTRTGYEVDGELFFEWWDSEGPHSVHFEREPGGEWYAVIKEAE